MDNIVKLWTSSDSPCPFAEGSFVGQAFWTKLSAEVGIGPSARQPDLAVLVLSVPKAVHAGFGMRLAHCSSNWRKWRQSGISVITLRTPGHRVFVAVDLAGLQDLEMLKGAASDGNLYAMPVSAELEEVTPLVPIYGLRDVLVEAAAVPRLSAREFTEAIADLRADLLQRSSWVELSGFDETVQTVTVNVCAPVPTGR